MSTQVASKLALGVLASASTASGSIVVFDVQHSLNTVGNRDISYYSFFMGSISFEDGTFSSDPFSGQSPSMTVLGLDRYDIWNATGSSNNVHSIFTENTSLGAEIGASLDFSPFYSAGGSLSDFTIGSSVYIGLRMFRDSQVNYGWLELGRSDASTLFISRFAFNTVANESILAGQTTAVPEASTLGFVGGVFGLVALAHARRRKAKQAAASEKFLALAAGEKLN